MQRHQHKEYSVGEEIVHAITHGIGVILSIVGLSWMLYVSINVADPWRIVASSIYGTTLIALFLASTLYHSMYASRHRDIFKLLDHCAIYLLIAGTYTPFTLVMIQGGWGWTLFGLIWGMTVLGFVCKIFLPTHFQAASVVSYLVMGWLAVIAAKPLIAAVPLNAVLWLLVGGLAYTAGTVFYGFKIVRYNHTVWHLFVIAGSLCHYLAVMFYVVPSA